MLFANSIYEKHKDKLISCDGARLNDEYLL